MDLNIFSELDFLPALNTFFEKLNIPINHLTNEPTTAKEILKDTYKDNDTFKLTNDVYFVGMIDDNAFDYKKESIALDKIKKDYDGILIFGVTLHKRPNGLLPTRTQLAEIARAFNREFYYTPVVVVFKYNNHIAFANTERLKYKQEWREGEKVGKVTLLRDVNIYKPHAGHHRILAELKIPTTGRNKVDSFAKLYTYWQEVLSVNILNTKFYQELSNWYFWAIQNVQFPGRPTLEDAIQNNKELEDLKQEHKATNVIRMLTRLLFVWFLKEKRLIPDELFDLKTLQEDILNKIDPIKKYGVFNEHNIESVYYKAILQNLFFATLNCPIEGDSIDKRKRGFRKGSSNFGTLFLMRYEEHFKDKDSFLSMVNQTVPFLNGGLFECLDERGEGEKKDERIWIDGFSDNLPKDQQLVVPDYLFFGLEEEADLSDVVGIDTREYKQAAVKGLINILESYKFTITENTPIEEDVALDPELLGKVFENLLASYNPETKTTARKQTGSFYTPREIVNYMVDESLIAYLTTVLDPTVLEASSFEKNSNVLEASSFEKTIPKQDASDTVEPQSRDASGTLQATFLDPNSEIEIKQGLLPHWKQDNVFYFVTFRLADSIPSDKQQELKNDREKWNKNKKDKKDYTKEEWKEYNRLFNNRVEDWLNAGYGSCLLGKPENASIVANALKHFDNQRYLLDEWVVMPNHVHVLVKPLGENKITDILHSWKSYTANEINKKEGRKGKLWMRESYDHIVRNEDSLNHIRHYIKQNPIKAGINVLEASNVLESSSFASNVLESSSFASNVLEASSFEKNSNVLEASSFEKTIPKQDASGTVQSQSRDASGTLRQLVSFDPKNPFSDNRKLTKEIITALSKCTIIDPACGSGAFPMGILQKMVHILQKLDPDNKVWKEVQREKANAESEEAFDKLEDKNARAQRLIEINEAFDESTNDPDYARKLFLIENCIYGVDIQPIATQISKLRFFISLVVEQKVNPEKENFGIRPLPNLETKFVAANTLIGIDRPKKGDQLNMFSTERLKELETELKQVRSKLFSAKTKDTKVKYRNRDEELRNAIAKELQQNGWESDTAQNLASWDPYDQNASSSFFHPEWMFDIKEGFDVVIGNPPYVQLKWIENSHYYENYETYVKSGDIYTLFYELSSEIMKNNGVGAFITSNKWLKAEYGKKLRNYLLKRTTPKILIDFGGYKVFESASVDTNILLWTKLSSNNQKTVFCKIKEEYNNKIDLHDYIKSNLKEIKFQENKQWLLLNQFENNIKLLSEKHKPLKNKGLQLYYGILTGANPVFIIDLETKSRLEQEDVNNAKIIKPLLRGQDLVKFGHNDPVRFLINSYSKVNKEGIDSVRIDKDFPSILNYFNSFGEKFKNRGEQGEYWFNLRSCNYILEFEKPKIIYADIVQDGGKFYFDTNKFYTNDTAFIIRGKNLKFITTILNSKTVDFLYKKFYCGGGLGHKGLRFKKEFLERVPLPDKPINSEYIDELHDILSFAAHKIYFKGFASISDALVFDLYFSEHMKMHNINVSLFIENDINKILKNRDFEKLNNQEKENVIEQLHTTWTNPNNEVVKRIGMFREKSPDLLGVILDS